MKKLSLIIALFISASMIMTACGGDKNIDNNDGKATSGTAVSGKVTDDKGNAVTDTDGSIVTVQGGEDKNNDGDSSKDEIEVQQSTTTAVQQATKVRYAYSSLTADEKKIYEKIMNAVSNFMPSVTFDAPVSFETYSKIFGLVYYQEPQLFWMRGIMEIYDGSKDNVYLNYRCSYDESIAMQKEIDASVDKIMKSIPANATVVDKLKVFHDYIVTNNKFEKELGLNQTVYGGLVAGKVQCEGYAKTMGYLCDKAGIENMLMTGTNSEKASHAWNIIKVDNEWYNLDCTWDDPQGGFAEDFIRYNYFLVTDAEILNKTHFQDKSYYNPPACTATKNNFQKYYKMYAENKDDGLKIIEDLMLKKSNEKNRYVQIKVNSEQVLNDINTELVTNKKIYDMMSTVNTKTKNKFSISVAPMLDKNTMTMLIILDY